MDLPSIFVFAGGGTGGHLFPGIAVARELQRREPSARIIFVGSTREIEATIVNEHGLEHRMLTVESLATLKRSPLRFLWRNSSALLAAYRLLLELHPTAVIGLGGFASAPLVWQARRHYVPVVLLEQNVIPGRTTRWLSRLADQICVTFAESASRLPHARNVKVTGNAVRAEIAALYRINRTIDVERKLLILGGSQGADSLNEAVIAAFRQIRELLTGWTIVHQTGPRQVEQMRQAHAELKCPAIVEPFFHDMPAQYASASLVISRAGASTLTELTCAGIAMILLPYPHAADDHQRANAKVFVDHGAALAIEHAETPESTGSQLAAALQQMLADPARQQAMGLAAKQLAQPDAAQRIANVILAVERK